MPNFEYLTEHQEKYKIFVLIDLIKTIILKFTTYELWPRSWWLYLNVLNLSKINVWNHKLSHSIPRLQNSLGPKSIKSHTPKKHTQSIKTQMQN